MVTVDQSSWSFMFSIFRLDCVTIAFSEFDD